jgi:hypothetical protein
VPNTNGNTYCPVDDPKYCFKTSTGNSFSYYSANNTSNPQVFSLYATNSNGTSYRISDDSKPTTISDSRTSCLAILNANESSGSGIYWIKPSGTVFPVYCDMVTDGGGWTLTVRLNTNDSTIQKWDSAFWTASSEQGSISNSNDYLSPAYYTLGIWDKILIDYRYTVGQQKRMVAAFSGSNSGTLQSQTTKSPSNSNPTWSRYYTNNSEATNWYGSSLVFQTLGNDADYHRIWYNQVATSACNQAGGIGVWGDGGNWYLEAAFPSNTVSCQENSIRGTLGTNGGGSLMTETELSPSDAYVAGIMYVLVK